MKYLPTIFLLLLYPGLTRAQQYWQQQVDYHIDVTLDDSAKTLDGAIQINYTNNSPDTLSFIWIHCYPNAFKNDRTAFTEQQLGNGKTDFYFSDIAQRGYINRLNFSVDGVEARIEDHPQYIDIIKVLLPRPLVPNNHIILTTPFHIKLPYNFSHSGYIGHSFQLTQWYPQPAVYDSHGWHPYPYLDPGASYGEFGSYDVHITVPNSYTIAATGEPKDTARTKTAKTVHFYQPNANDFTWFADRRFHLQHDTMQLASGRVIDIYSWDYNFDEIKAAIRFHSALIGEYPYNTITVVKTPETIFHQIGRLWFSAILGPDSRRYPYLAEGLNAYYDNRYKPARNNDFVLATLAAEKKDQPITTSAEDFDSLNYYEIARNKTALWMKMLEDSLGRTGFDSSMHEYFRRWQFKHPYPDDFKAAFGQKHFDTLFSLLDKKGSLPPPPAHRRLVPWALFNLQHTDSIHYLNFYPAIAYNDYDHLMVGLVIHNFNLPPNPVQFFVAPLYSAASHQLNGDGGIFYTRYPDHGLQKIRFSINAARFSTSNGTDSNNHQFTGGFYKVVPGIRLIFPKANARSTQQIALEWKTFLIGEKMLDHYVLKTADSLYYPVPGKYSFRYLNQLSLDIRDTRALYPYKAVLELQQAANFYRVNFTGNYFLNYQHGGGLDFRLFGAKFGYLGSRSSSIDLNRYMPKLTAVRGDEDYTYSNFFIGRNQFDGFSSQQIMDRDGDLKLRTDLFSGLQGRSDNWVASINLATTLPRQMIPAWLPLKIFFDVGTYSGAWGAQPLTSHFLYDGGIQLSLLHDVLHVYAPLVYSSDFSNQLKSVPDQNTFRKKLSFAIDLSKLYSGKLYGHKFFDE